MKLIELNENFGISSQELSPYLRRELIGHLGLRDDSGRHMGAFSDAEIHVRYYKSEGTFDR